MTTTTKHFGSAAFYTVTQTIGEGGELQPPEPLPLNLPMIGTHNFNATQLIGFIQDWVTSAPQINIKDYSVWLDTSCPVAITTLREPEYGEVSQCPCANDPNVIKCMENLENEDFTSCIRLMHLSTRIIYWIANSSA